MTLSNDDPCHLQEFEVKAAKDKLRFAEEMKSYTPPAEESDDEIDNEEEDAHADAQQDEAATEAVTEVTDESAHAAGATKSIASTPAIDLSGDSDSGVEVLCSWLAQAVSASRASASAASSAASPPAAVKLPQLPQLPQLPPKTLIRYQQAIRRNELSAGDLAAVAESTNSGAEKDIQGTVMEETCADGRDVVQPTKGHAAG
jgi:hypothetical protein